MKSLTSHILEGFKLDKLPDLEKILKNYRSVTNTEIEYQDIANLLNRLGLVNTYASRLTEITSGKKGKIKISDGVIITSGRDNIMSLINMLEENDYGYNILKHVPKTRKLDSVKVHTMYSDLTNYDFKRYVYTLGEILQLDNERSVISTLQPSEKMFKDIETKYKKYLDKVVITSYTTSGFGVEVRFVDMDYDYKTYNEISYFVGLIVNMKLSI